MGLLNNNGPIMSRRTSGSNSKMDALDIFMNSSTQHYEKIKEDQKEPMHSPTLDANDYPDDNIIKPEEMKIEENEYDVETDGQVDIDVEVYDAQNIDEETNEILRGLNMNTASAVPDEMEFGTSAVAAALGCSMQSIRNYCNTYGKFLDIETTKSGTRRFRMKDIRRLEKIITVKRERGYTTQQMIAFLEDEGKNELVVTDEDRINALAQRVSDAVFGQLIDYIEKSGVLEQFTEREKQLLLRQEEMSSTLEDRHDEIEKLKEALDAKFDELNRKEEKMEHFLDSFSEERMKKMNEDRKHIEELEKKIQESTAQMDDIIKSKDERIAALEEEIEKSQKKRRFFFLK